jgi:hypothetical protein
MMLVFDLQKRLAAGCLLVVLFLAVGCATRNPQHRCAEVPFQFGANTFAYANDTVWEYSFNEEGKWKGEKKSPRPEYSLHCVPVSRAARQFFEHARFAPDLPKATQIEYTRLARRVARTNPGAPTPDIIIPGYANLHEFSAAEPKLLQDACGGAWQSYFQRGNWRMVFPFSRKHQRNTSHQLLGELRRNCPPILHVVRFPQLSINHTVLLYDHLETHDGVIFVAYDPNDPLHPIGINFDAKAGWFIFPQTKYFPGGRVNAYQTHTGWMY